MIIGRREEEVCWRQALYRVVRLGGWVGELEQIVDYRGLNGTNIVEGGLDAERERR